jgi:hypothetical protein
MNSFTKTQCVQCKIYYGSEERMGMCSVCFKDYKNKEIANSEPKKEEKKIPNEDVKMTEINEVKDVKATEENDEKPVEKPIQTNPHSCWICNKKIGYLGFKCKCDYIFCGTHRHFSDHNCDFDYKKYDREKLVKKNNYGETNENKMIK